MQSVDYISLVFSVWFWEMGCCEFSSGGRKLLLCPSVSQSSLILTAPVQLLNLYNRGVSETQWQASMKNFNSAGGQQDGRSGEPPVLSEEAEAARQGSSVDQAAATATRCMQDWEVNYRKIQYQLSQTEIQMAGK